MRRCHRTGHDEHISSTVWFGPSSTRERVAGIPIACSRATTWSRRMPGCRAEARQEEPERVTLGRNNLSCRDPDRDGHDVRTGLPQVPRLNTRIKLLRELSIRGGKPNPMRGHSWHCRRISGNDLHRRPPPTGRECLLPARGTTGRSSGCPRPARSSTASPALSAGRRPAVCAECRRAWSRHSRCRRDIR